MSPLFRGRNRRRADPRPAIAGFWTWWGENRAAVIAAADSADRERLTELLRPAVAAVDPDLVWELADGFDARYALVVSGGGNPGLRAVAERWFRAAPEPDSDVEYAPVRRPDPRLFERSLTVDDYELPMNELLAGTSVDRQRGRLDVTVHHPLFPLLDDESRRRVAFHALEAALGEDDVERWLGAVDVSADAPIDAIAVSTLRAVVDQLRPPGAQWAVLKGRGPRGTVLATVRRPFGPADRPLCDTHVTLTLRYPPGPDGLPADESVTAAIQQLEEEVVTALGGDGPHAVLLGHEIAGGRVVVRLYVDGLEVDAGRAKPVLTSWKHGTARIAVRRDPAWRAVGHLLG